MKRGQGAFEYIILIGGVLLIVVLITIILRSSILPTASSQLTNNSAVIGQLVCLPTYIKKPHEVAGFWRLDDGAGMWARDDSGIGNSGTLQGNIQWVDGRLHGAVAGVATGDRVAISDHPRYTPNSITVSAWVQGSTTAGLKPFINKGANGYRILQSFVNSFRCAMTGVVPSSLNGGSVAVPGQWYHVACVYDKDNAITLYVNGEVDGGPLAASGSLTYDSGNLQILGKPMGSYHGGAIDQVVIYDRALTPEEVRADYECADNSIA
ncbi:class III signal peptide-containing protein [Candidatus Micrarchaeota archaeon]|nr:class III signal peptide-containing protein [Candidatus Micrarchaeota archaeon]